MKFTNNIVTCTTLLLVSILPVQAEKNPTQNEVDLTAIARQIGKVMEDHHYDPDQLKQSAYQTLQRKALQLAQNADSEKSFIDQFNQLWMDGPFSHVRLDFAKMDAQTLANYLDSMEIGGSGCQLSWEGETAILTVNSMMGLDTIRQINEAYQEIISNNAKALVIDLRNNHGGAFAVKPLVAHLIKKPLDTGVFVSQNWTEKHDQPPSNEEIESIDPWEGWSIKAFWEDVVTHGVLRIQMQPAEKVYDGPVCVLISQATASAAELAADAMGQLENVVIIGETSAGQMLSQTMFDLAGGLQLSLPIADYFSSSTGRIEGQGVTPDISILASDAMQAAQKWIEANTSKSPENKAL